MKILSLLLIYLGLGFFKPSTEINNPGLSLYEKSCAFCHGKDGRLGIGGAKLLPESSLNLEERIHVISNGREGTSMLPFAHRFNEEEIRAIAEYTMTLK